MSVAERANRGVKILGVTLALVNGVLWFATPALRRAVVDARAAALPEVDRPRIVTGVQELLVYFDPWLARGVFPVVYTAGLAAIPLLRSPATRRPGAAPGLASAVVLVVLLFAFEAVWLFLTGVGLFLRGPNWNLFWPGEAWDPYKVVPLNHVNFSDYFWTAWLGEPAQGRPWALRELPGFLLVGTYFLAGVILAQILFRATGRATPSWRWLVLVMLIQIAALVPLKMLTHWLFNLKYWIGIPEYWVNV